MDRNDTGMNRNRQFLHMYANIVCIFFKSIRRGIKCAVTTTLLIILHSLTPSPPPMHPFCSESNNLGKGEGGGGGPRYVELVVKPYTMEIDSI